MKKLDMAWETPSLDFSSAKANSCSSFELGKCYVHFQASSITTKNKKKLQLGIFHQLGNAGSN